MSGPVLSRAEWEVASEGAIRRHDDALRSLLREASLRLRTAIAGCRCLDSGSGPPCENCQNDLSLCRRLDVAAGGGA